MSAESLDLAKTEYQTGKTAFERGDYRQSVRHLERANALVAPGTRLGGEMQIWLVTAYEAAGQRSEALTLCRQVTRHPDLKTRQQGRRILYILEAPQLKTRPEWLTKIPDLSNLPDNGSEPQWSASKFGSATPPKRPPKPQVYQPETVDLSQVNTQDNQFIWVALLAILVILGSLAFFS